LCTRWQIVVLSRWALKRDESGNPAAVLEIDSDITGRKQAEGQVRDLSTHLIHLQDEERRRIARGLERPPTKGSHRSD
jgi:signal transduction histidine kinase